MLNFKREKNKKIDCIIDILRLKFPSIIVIYLYGSFVKNQENKNSDIDIAFLDFNKHSRLELFHLSNELSVKVNQDVELLDLKNSSITMKWQVISTGKPVYIQDQYKLEVFEMIIFSSYFEFNEMRKHIIEDIYKRGSIYG